MSKTLSTGTLSLKFMQNAHRRKEMKEVELDRAEVKDDGEWEVSQAVRDAWGLGKDTSSQPIDVHEPSYLPFLYPEKGNVAHEATGSGEAPMRAPGRRIFNKKGEDVSSMPSTSVLPAQEPAASTSTQPSTGRKVHPRPISISAAGKSGQLKGFEQLKKPKDAKSARQAIFDGGNVGTDLRTQVKAEPSQSQPPLASTSFMKPAGVDDPKDLEAKANSGPKPSKSLEIIEGARRKQVKREREQGGDEAGELKKPKKKKKKAD